jgi:glycosyltransferase involved in cell wall biosynthesis
MELNPMNDCEREATLDLSVVLPVYNEEDPLPSVISELSEVLGSMGCTYEIVAVDDGSTDNTVPLLRELQAQEHNLRIIQFRRNFGQTPAFQAGFDHARGDVIVTMDADGQQDPADIPALLATLEEGDYDLVNGWRQDRKEPLTRKMLSFFGNRVIANTSAIDIHDRGCSLKAFRCDLAKQMKLYGELHRFLPELANLVGARIGEVPVNDRPRKAGKSKYGAFSRAPRVLLDLFTISFLLTYSHRPMQLFGRAGLLSGGAGTLILLYLGGFKIANGLLYGETAFREFRIGNSPWTILSVMLIVLGAQFLMMGFLGEILNRTYHEAQGKPIYSIRKIWEGEQQ